jgi:hypothetical protein
MDLANFHTALVDFRTIYTFGFRVPNLNIRTYTDIHSLKSSFASSLSLSLTSKIVNILSFSDYSPETSMVKVT